jgi:hypothetical protein
MTVAALAQVPPSATPALPAPEPLRRLPLPVSEPPYDDAGAWTQRPDAHPAPAAAVQGSLALAFDLATGVPAVPSLRLVTEAEPAPSRPVRRAGVHEDEDFAPRATPRSALPDPHPWAGRFLQALAEALVGARPPSQLVRWTSVEVYEELQRQLRASLRSAPGTRPRSLVRSLHLSEPADGVAEVCALLQRGPRACAVAVRLEGIDGRWQCTALALP